MQRTLDTLAKRVYARANDLDEGFDAVAEDLRTALAAVTSNPSISLTKSRTALEAIVKSVYRYELGTLPDQTLLGEMLQNKKLQHGLEKRIFFRMKFVKEMGNLGPHDEPVYEQDAVRTLDILCDILDWHSAEYLLRNLFDNFGNEISKDCFLVLYLSNGGTCRCAMANIITRHLLNATAAPGKVISMSAACGVPTSPTITPEAASVLASQLGESFRNHKSIQADERYYRRANLILPMDVKLLESLPLYARRKAMLFSEFYGGSGNIIDPYGGGLSVYEQCFSTLRGLIASRSGHLVGWLTGRAGGLADVSR